MSFGKKIGLAATASAIALTAGIGSDGVSIGQTALAQAIEEIIVTARKREERLIDIPLAVSAFSQADIEARGVTTLSDLAAFTPGFDFQDVGAGGASGRENPQIRFRGVGVQNENPASRAGAVFWDGAYLSAGAGLVPLFDLERVEVIKGPQNAFYGRNTFAGAVNYIPPSVGEEYGGNGTLKYSPSDDDSYEVSGAVNLPLGDLGIRIGAFYEKVGADTTFGNGDPLNEEKTFALTGVAELQVNEKLSFKASGFYVDSEDTRSLVSQDFTNAPGTCNLVFNGDLYEVVSQRIIGSFTTDLANSARGTFCGNIPDYDENGFNVPSTGTLGPNTPLDPFSGSVEFAQTSVPELQGKTIVDAPAGIGNTYYTWRANLSADYELPGEHTLSLLYSRGITSTWSINDQLYGQSPSGALRLTGIRLYSEDDYYQARINNAQDKRLRYTLGISYYQNEYMTADTPAFAGLGGTFDNNNIQDIEGENLGIFGSIDFDILENLTVSLEGRWNEDTQTLVYIGQTNRDGPITTAVRGEEQSYSDFMPRILVSYKPTEDINIYGSWALSYLQGNQTNALNYSIQVPEAGLNPDTLGFFTPKQELTAYEVGVKASPFDWLTGSVALYYMEWQNQVQFELSPNFTALYNAADSEYFGIEAEATITPTPGFTLSGNFNWVDAELTNFAGAGSVATQILNPALVAGTQISAIGNQPRYIPEWSGAIAATLQLDELIGAKLPIFVRADATYFGDFYEDNFEYNQIDGYWRYNARIGVDVNENLTVEFYGLNLSNDQSFETNGGTTTGSLGSSVPFATRKTFSTLPKAREIGIEAKFRF